MNIQAPYQQGIDAAIAHLAEGNARNTTPPASMYRKFNKEQREVGGSPIFVIRSRVTAPQRRFPFFHGGGGMMRATPFHFAFITRLILQTQAEVWIPFYPLAPGVNFYDSLDVCLATHQTMLTEANQLPIYFAGDSAGANLELAICRRALDAGFNSPHAIICMSPATSMEAAGVPLTTNRGTGLMHDWALLNYFPEGAAA